MSTKKVVANRCGLSWVHELKVVSDSERIKYILRRTKEDYLDNKYFLVPNHMQLLAIAFGLLTSFNLLQRTFTLLGRRTVVRMMISKRTIYLQTIAIQRIIL